MKFDDIFSIKVFSDDIENYILLKSFWNDSIRELIGTESESYVHNFYANGREIMDGNPIYSTLLKHKKGLRIIQIEEDPDEPLFASWTDTITINDEEIDELVISLQLTPETFHDTRLLVQLFITNALSSSIINGVNEKFDMKWNVSKLDHLVHSVNFSPTLHVFSNLVMKIGS